MRCTVIGGSGFLGGAIIRELLGRGDEVRSADRSGSTPSPDLEAVICDILNPNEVEAAVCGADEVYHVAGLLGTAELNSNIAPAIRVNIEGAVNVFQACLKAGVPRVFYPSKPHPWLNAYTITKQASERFAEMFDGNGTTITRLRWFNAFGPGQHLKPVRKIIPTFIACALMQRPMPIWGTGENTVDMIYSEDLARITVDATRFGLNSRTYDLGTGCGMTVMQVAGDVIDAAGGRNVPSDMAAPPRRQPTARRRFVHEPMRAGEDEGTRLEADIGELTVRMAARNRPLRFTPWKEALAATWDYYAGLPTEEIRAALDYHGLL